MTVGRLKFYDGSGWTYAGAGVSGFSGYSGSSGVSGYSGTITATGTWDPTYNSAGGSFTYTNQFGTYVKIGNIVFCCFQIATGSSTVGTGAVKVGGLPYTVSNTTDARGAGSIANAFNFAGDVPSEIVINENQTQVFLYYRTSPNGASIALDGTDLDSGSSKNIMYGSFWYVTTE